MTPVDDSSTLRRDYTECRFGQLHFVELPTLSRDVFEVGVGEFCAERRRFLK